MFASLSKFFFNNSQFMEGTSAADWREVRFHPKLDITAFELAQVLIAFCGVPREPCYIPRDPEALARRTGKFDAEDITRTRLIARHFEDYHP